MKSIILSLLLLPLATLAAPKAELWPHWQSANAQNPAQIDHSAWDQFLQTYLVQSQQPYRLAYAKVSPADRAALQAYLQALQALRPQNYQAKEQMAYWINLYNVATVELILQHYPVKSITKIKSGFFSFGPWDKKLLTVDGQTLSLNDIEHRILRPIFKDPRIHYAVNCASIGCPNLAPSAYRRDNLNELLDAGARAYINHPRGVEIRGNKLVVSSIYEWFQSDFGANQAEVIEHFKLYADAALKQALEPFSAWDDDSYDWSLNAP